MEKYEKSKIWNCDEGAMEKEYLIREGMEKLKFDGESDDEDSKDETPEVVAEEIRNNI